MNKYNYAFLDENTKKEIRRAILKAVAIPGYQVPFGSREMPIARGWGTGGLQVTLSIVGEHDCVKVIDQGCDDSVNACNIRELIEQTTGVETTTDTLQASIIQTRHRIPEEKMTKEQILVFQVPLPEPLRKVEPSEKKTREMHGERDYSKLWVLLYENIVKWGEITIAARYPVTVHHRYIMDPSPIPRFDVPKLHQAKTLFLFGAGREKRIYAIPPHTDVIPLQFEDYRFQKEKHKGISCMYCHSETSFLDEVYDQETGNVQYCCSDTSYCLKRRNQQAGKSVMIGGAWDE
ncbi:alpha-D-ribose 1-methylphosphonate 5-phosphate C-P-lyase PhnJ [Alkalihalobacterium bogoriense]|uniref:alpha-D-ribose 1-methylphosphonate 5-phosphate C-P-lyase PhnJ n=1 Tax=Alkalihalobacterium bogoriense TaxID=246272 RepID=UPI00047E2EEF|nr:alpha-D-ribose 1-methylphosphonate 5-phosphate C-P-lyase PhnJ [Alkalihalobacterium bogoriense]